MNMKDLPSVGTFHGTSRQKAVHLIQSAFLRAETVTLLKRCVGLSQKACNATLRLGNRRSNAAMIQREYFNACNVTIVRFNPLLRVREA